VLRKGISSNIHRAVFKSYPQLISLSLNDACIDKPLSELKTILSYTPSLEYFKVIALISDGSLFDGSEWESIIVTYLPHLNKFEFFFSEYNISNDNSVDMRSRMDRYRTPFWVDTKGWGVVCTYEPRMQTIMVYSTPMCRTSYTYRSRYRKKSIYVSISIRNFETDLHLLSKTSMTTTTEQQVYLILLTKNRVYVLIG
jgi:hypothetical protein